MKSKKFLFFILLLSCAVSAAFSFDWGAELSNTASASQPMALEADDAAKFSVWVKAPLDYSHNTWFTAEGFFKTQFFYPDLTFDFTTDITLLKLSMTIKLSELNFGRFEMGRLQFTDSSSLVMAQSADGFKFFWDSPVLNAEIFGGFTGLINARTNPIYLAFDDTSPRFYSMSSPFMLTGVNFSFPQLFSGKTLTVESYGAFNTSGTLDHRLYAAAALSGNLSPNSYYLLSSTFGWMLSSESGFSKPSNLSQAELAIYKGKTSITASAIYASAENGTLSDFIPFTTIYADLISNRIYSGTIKANMIATLRFTRGFLGSVSGGAFFTLPKENATEGYSGAQWTAALKFQAASDLQFTISGGQYYGTTADSNYTFASINFILSL